MKKLTRAEKLIIIQYLGKIDRELDDDELIKHFDEILFTKIDRVIDERIFKRLDCIELKTNENLDRSEIILRSAVTALRSARGLE